MKSSVLAADREATFKTLRQQMQESKKSTTDYYFLSQLVAADHNFMSPLNHASGKFGKRLNVSGGTVDVKGCVFEYATSQVEPFMSNSKSPDFIFTLYDRHICPRLEIFKI